MSSISDEQTSTDDAALEDAPVDTVEESTDDETKDWEAEFKAQQKINRDLERKNKRAFDDIRRQVLAEEAKKKPADDADKPDLDALRAEIKAEARAETLRERALDKLEAKAARLFKNPDDARAFLAGKVDEFIVDDKVDIEAISDALGDLLTDRPYLGVTQGDAKRFKGTGDGGPKGNAGKPQLTQQDVQRLAAEGKHEEIVTAKQEGRLNDLLGIK